MCRVGLRLIINGGSMSNLACVTELEDSRDEILGNLEALLTDRRFASAERNGKFLRYVVERTLDGKADEIKETVIATEVYGRMANYDPKSDSIVRVEATRLRQKLRTYYDNEGQNAAVRIRLPSGTYVPQFEAVPVVEPQETPNRAPEAPEVAPVLSPVTSRLSCQPLAWAG